MSARPSPPAVLLPLLAGAALVTALHAVLTPALVGTFFLDGKFLVYLANNLLAAGALGAAWLLLGREAGAGHVACFWRGVASALGPFLTSWAFAVPPLEAWRESEIVPAVSGTAATLALLFALPHWLRAAPSRRVCAGVLAVALAAGAALYARAGVQPPARPTLPLPGAPRTAAPRSAGPDVVLISVDTLRADAVAGAGLELPNFDRLRSHGLARDWALAPAPMTLPSHATMLSGRTPLYHGAWNNAAELPSGEVLPLAAWYFRARGWRTAGVAANGVLRAANGFGQGFEVYDNLGNRSEVVVSGRRILRTVARHSTWSGWLLPASLGDKLTLMLASRRQPLKTEGPVTVTQLARDKALEYLDGLIAGDAPYFLFCQFLDPHHPYNPPAAQRGRVVDAAAMPARYQSLPLGEKPQIDAVQADMQQGVAEAFEAVEVLHGLYLEEVLFIDECLGRLLDRVEAGGRPTIVLLTGDHGEQFGEHGYTNHGNTVYEPLLRVPFILAGFGGARIPGGRELARRPRLEDVLPTLLARAGLPVPPALEGVDLFGAGLPAPPAWAWRPEQFAFRDAGWKLIGTFERQPEGYAKVRATELYHLQADPGELTDLLEEEPERAAAMLEEARLLLSSARVGSQAELSAEDQRMLTELGYVDDLQESRERPER